MNKWLLNRLIHDKDQPNPQFAFQGTVNWARALAKIIDSDEVNDERLIDLYREVSLRKVNEEADTYTFNFLLMAYHNLSSLNSLHQNFNSHYDTCRLAIIAWYYTTYFSASAMVSACDGSTQQTHMETAKHWQRILVEKNLIAYPFDLHLSNLTSKNVEKQLEENRSGNEYTLNDEIISTEVAHGALISYLKGTYNYRKWQVENRIRESKEFKQLNVQDFRTKNAQLIRDKALEKEGVNYLMQAFRYRGKANYRDSIFLSYGPDKSEQIKQLIEDLLKISERFLRMSVLYCSKRVEKGTWESFITDMEEQSRLSLELDVLKV